MSRIAFLGLGNMGLPMATNLARAGHVVTGFDLSPAALAAFSAHGAVADSVAACVADAVAAAVTAVAAAVAAVAGHFEQAKDRRGGAFSSALELSRLERGRRGNAAIWRSQAPPSIAPRDSRASAP